MSSSRPSIFHILMDEKGGAQGHVELLTKPLEDIFESQVSLVDPHTAPGKPLRLRQARAKLDQAGIRDASLIHAHGVRAGMVAIKARRDRQPFVVTVHGLHSLRRTQPWLSYPIRLLNRRVLSAADAVLALSTSDRDTILTLSLASSDRVRLIRAAVVPPQTIGKASARKLLGVDETRPLVIWVGRLDHQKDPVTFIRAISAVEDRNVLALIAGDGDLSRQVAHEIEHLRVGDQIKLLGWVADCAPLYCAADLFVSSALWEGLPVSVLEAATYDAPTLLTDVPGNTDIARDLPGLPLVPSRRPDLMAREIKRLLNDEEGSKEIGRSAGEFVRSTYTAANLRDDVALVYDDLLSGAISRPETPNSEKTSSKRR